MNSSFTPHHDKTVSIHHPVTRLSLAGEIGRQSDYGNFKKRNKLGISASTTIKMVITHYVHQNQVFVNRF